MNHICQLFVVQAGQYPDTLQIWTCDRAVTQCNSWALCHIPTLSLQALYWQKKGIPMLHPSKSPWSQIRRMVKAQCNSGGQIPGAGEI